MLSVRHNAIVTYFILSLLLSCVALPLSTPTTAEAECAPTDWAGVLLFFVASYISHAGTVPAHPAAKWYEQLPFITSLFLPFAGLGRTVGLFWAYILYGKDDLGKAISQGAVVVAARSCSWKPVVGENFFGEKWRNPVIGNQLDAKYFTFLPC